jgi:hypothetical protein
MKKFSAILMASVITLGWVFSSCATTGGSSSIPPEIRKAETEMSRAGKIVGSGEYKINGNFDYARDMAEMRAKSKIAQQLSSKLQTKMVDIVGSGNTGTDTAGGRVITQVANANLSGTKIVDYIDFNGSIWVLVEYDVNAAKKLIQSTIDAAQLSADQKRAMGTKQFIDAMFE